jgi:hypothetical protein
LTHLNILVQLIAVVCEEDPPIVENTSLGMFDWSGNNTYLTTIKYWCPKAGWGFKSSGLQRLNTTCQADGTWSLGTIEDCIGKLIFMCTYIGLQNN